MKKILLIGSAYAEILAEVNELPKGNEPFTPLNVEETVNGDAYCMYRFAQAVGMDCDLIATIGSGVYGEMVDDTFSSLQIPHGPVFEELNGCTYHLKDRNGQESFITVPGEEFEFHIENLEDIYPEEYYAVIVNDEVLTSENVDELLTALEDMELPVYLNLTGRVGNLDRDVLDSLYQLHPIVCISDTDIYEVHDGKTSELKESSAMIQKKTENDVLVYQKGTGVYFNDGEETYLAPFEKELQQTFLLISYVIARNCGIDKKNALMFAIDAGSVRTLDDLTAFETERLKRLLADKIW